MTPWYPPRTRPPQMATLTARQAALLDLLCEGLSTPEIAAELYLTQNSVKTHLRRLYARLDARNRAHAAALACTGQVRIVVTGDYPQRRAA